MGSIHEESGRQFTVFKTAQTLVFYKSVEYEQHRFQGTDEDFLPVHPVAGACFKKYRAIMARCDYAYAKNHRHG